MTIVSDAEETACAAALRGLSGTDAACDAANAVLRAIRALKAEPSLVLLEGLSRLARLPGAEDASLKALLLCAANAPGTWEAIISAGIPLIFPRFTQLVADTFMSEEPPLENDVQLKLTRLSEVPLTPTYRASVTPASLTVRALFSGDDSDETKSAERARFVDKLSALAWMHLEKADLALVASKLSADDVDANIFRGAFGTRLRRAFAAPSPAAAQVYVALDNVLPAEARSLRSRHSSSFETMITAESRKTPLFDDVNDPESAFAAGCAAFKAGEYSKAALAAKRFRADGKLDLSGAVYIACPKVISRVQYVSHDLVKTIVELPMWFRGPVDDALDCALRSLLGAVPALSKVYKGLQNMQTGRAADLALRRAALIHPALVLRRMDDVCAAAYVVMEGLSQSNDRYHSLALFAVQAIFSSIVRVQTETNQRNSEVLEAGLVAKDLLLDEGRGENGIPEVLAQFAVATLQLLGMYPREIKARGLVQVFKSVLAAPGTVPEVTKAITGFLDKAEAQQSAKCFHF